MRKRGIGVTSVLIAIVAVITVAAAFVGYYLGSGKGGAGVLRSVSISISPRSQSGATGTKLTYLVTVTNTGNVSDSYSLGVDWGSLSYTISPSILSINAGDSENATLTVTVGPVSEVMEIYCATDETVTDKGTFTVNVTGKELYALTTIIDGDVKCSVSLNPAGEQYGPPILPRLNLLGVSTVGYLGGTVVTATATSSWGYEFDNWSGYASGTATSVTVTMNSDKSITANFRREENMISIIDFVFQQSSITVGVGTTVTWKNNGSVTHTVTSTSGLFNSGNISPGDNFQFTFENAGTYAYHCSIHTFMTGTVVVQ